MAVIAGIGVGVLVAAIAGIRMVPWLKKRQLRYKRHRIVDFAEIRAAARTGDILLFHKTTRSGFLDALELDVVSPMLFDQNEFRHSGIVVRKDGELFVMECADQLHSGHDEATYLTPGNGIRIVAMETLLRAYNRDNGDPHFGIKHIADEISVDRVYAALAQFGRIDYLKMYWSAYVFLSCAVLPKKMHPRVLDKYRNEMMCSEFVHSLLNMCGVLKNYPSKLFAPYTIEDTAAFREFEIVKYSDVVRFRYESPKPVIEGIRAELAPPGTPGPP